jgi:LAO/AO transport system kinase
MLRRKKMTHKVTPTQSLLEGLHKGDKKALARCISIVENELSGYEDILCALKIEKNIPVIGITGPPGCGKSTFVNAFTKELLSAHKKIGIIAVDPSSPFNYGSLLGDRIRMGDHTNNPSVFIRSMASRGALGGLSVKTLEVLDLMRASDFDIVLIETVGVGQSEVEVAGLANTTLLLLNPEGGDSVQALKSGIMEIADIFVVNKSDLPGAETLANTLTAMLHARPLAEWSQPVLKVSAFSETGFKEVLEQVFRHENQNDKSKQLQLLSEKAFQLIQYRKMKDLDRGKLQDAIARELNHSGFNMYAFVSRWIVGQ